ncbi:hypothetical protein DENSPDRAFT_885798 [Dentipellis sp. KUC8613]|nr:hypothetical protein DENSPDRAFT_885798 [Dentipellis sp. KUC8613]
MQVLPSPPTAQVSSYPLTLTLIGPPALTAPCAPRNHPPCTITPPRNRPARYRARPCPRHPVLRLRRPLLRLRCPIPHLHHPHVARTTLMWPAPPSCGPYCPRAAAHCPRVAATRAPTYRAFAPIPSSPAPVPPSHGAAPPARRRYTPSRATRGSRPRPAALSCPRTAATHAHATRRRLAAGDPALPSRSSRAPLALLSRSPHASSHCHHMPSRRYHMPTPPSCTPTVPSRAPVAQHPPSRIVTRPRAQSFAALALPLRTVPLSSHTVMLSSRAVAQPSCALAAPSSTIVRPPPPCSNTICFRHVPCITRFRHVPLSAPHAPLCHPFNPLALAVVSAPVRPRSAVTPSPPFCAVWTPSRPLAPCNRRATPSGPLPRCVPLSHAPWCPKVLHRRPLVPYGAMLRAVAPCCAVLRRLDCCLAPRRALAPPRHRLHPSNAASCSPPPTLAATHTRRHPSGTFACPRTAAAPHRRATITRTVLPSRINN